jgi:hypothetical protein
MGLHHLARVRNEKPFAVLVDALQVQVCDHSARLPLAI